jgi:hypothetical protein
VRLYGLYLKDSLVADENKLKTLLRRTQGPLARRDQRLVAGRGSF